MSYHIYIYLHNLTTRFVPCKASILSAAADKAPRIGPTKAGGDGERTAGEASGFPRAEFSCAMHRVCDFAASLVDSPWTVVERVAFPMILQGRHAEWMISEFNGWPAWASILAPPAM